MEDFLIKVAICQFFAICFALFFIYDKLENKIYNLERDIRKSIYESEKEIKNSQRRQ